MTWFNLPWDDPGPMYDFMDFANSPRTPFTPSMNFTSPIYELERQPNEWGFPSRHRVSGNPFMQFFGALPLMNQIPKYRKGLDINQLRRPPLLLGDYPMSLDDSFPAENLPPWFIEQENFLRQLWRPSFQNESWFEPYNFNLFGQ